ncbi:MAG: biotin/lipoyl-binding protein [Christensenellaceae bacterium]|jgi:biotin carboxyl carrier protein|nr:biotin/lipoyl-binding protein [Christensenellaceae bacterium]
MATRKFELKINGQGYRVEIEEVAEFAATAAPVVSAPVAPVVSAPVAVAPEAPAAVGSGEPIQSPLPGTVVKVIAKEGGKVKAGEVIVVVEAMKMENDIVAPRAGTVSGLIAQGKTVGAGDILAYLA